MICGVCSGVISEVKVTQHFHLKRNLLQTWKSCRGVLYICCVSGLHHCTLLTFELLLAGKKNSRLGPKKVSNSQLQRAINIRKIDFHSPKLANNLDKDIENEMHSIFISAPQCIGFDHLSKVLSFHSGYAEKSFMGRFKYSCLH